jgi:phosphotriesterase-related protein
MWDRRNYRDSDFGLADGESFEPTNVDDPEDIDLTHPHIMTVLGPIVPDQLGTCLPHERILWDPEGVAQDDIADHPDRLNIACQALEAFVTVGGRSMVDLTTVDRGRNLLGLRTIAQRVPVHVIAVTGRDRHINAAPMTNSLDRCAIEQELLSDIHANIKPGVITFGSSVNAITDVERIAALAGASVAVLSGYPVTICLEAGTMAHEMLDIVEGTGLNPTRVILAHLDHRLDIDYLAGIANRGALISFDRVGDAGPGDEASKADMLVRLADAGYEDQLLISQGQSRKSDPIAYGSSHGWNHLLERFTLELMRADASAQLVRKLLIENPARALTIRP